MDDSPLQKRWQIVYVVTSMMEALMRTVLLFVDEYNTQKWKQNVGKSTLIIFDLCDVLIDPFNIFHSDHANAEYKFAFNSTHNARLISFEKVEEIPFHLRCCEIVYANFHFKYFTINILLNTIVHERVKIRSEYFSLQLQYSTLHK